MLVCFGLAWPFSIYKSATTRQIGSASLPFLVALLIILYALNGTMVSTHITLYLRNRGYHVRESAGKAH